MKEESIDLDSVIENKLRENLKWSMLFFIFNFIASNNDAKDKDAPHNDLIKTFFKSWKKHTCDNVVKKDLESINSILNSPKNIFHSILQNSTETIESTEIYQEKYNNILKKIEEFYFDNVSSMKNNND